MSIEESVEAKNRHQDLRLIQKLDKGDFLDRGGLPMGGLTYDSIKLLEHVIPNYSFSNNESITKIKNGEINLLNATAKNLVTSIEIFQQGSDRQRFSISLSPSEATGAFIEQRVTTVEEEQRLLYVARDSSELSAAGRHGYIRAEKSNEADFTVTGSLLVDDQYMIGNLNVMTAKIFNCFVVLFGEVVRKSNVWHIAGKLGVKSIDVVTTNTGNLEINMAYSTLSDKAIVDTKTKIVTMYRADHTKFYFDLDEPSTDMQKAIRMLTVLAVSSLEDTGFFINTIGTKTTPPRKPLTFGFSSPTIYGSITLDDLLKHSKKRFVKVTQDNGITDEDGLINLSNGGLLFE